MIAGGDVFVWGSLRGDVVAGSKGDQRAKVFSLDFRPTSLVIAGVRRSTPPEETGASGARRAASGVPQVAEVTDGSSNLSSDAARNVVVKAGRRVIVTPANPAAARFAEERRHRKHAIKCSENARKASAATGAYVSLLGFALMFFPSQVFGLLFDVEAITDGWIRVFGVLCVAFGTYYLGCAYGDENGLGTRGFYVATVFGRAFIFISFLGFVALGWHPEPKLLVLGFINLVGALAMWHALGGNAKGKPDLRDGTGGGGREVS